ncbi:hypothetical protein [Natronoglycomyces albus]|uniref:Uncharacterized protein n=1 Tax=Natronoglycomyces albus TaxID=2811108 RepID=A0A895XFI3_9ACTN|nr:hypothetical protein [Natronoglycomyces albus]QSB04084.1 hypothetical protein JQS30_09660 [Natronoglycomyces albus]
MTDHGQSLSSTHNAQGSEAEVGPTFSDVPRSENMAASEVVSAQTPCSCGLGSTQDEFDWQVLMSAVVDAGQSGSLHPNGQYRPTPDSPTFLKMLDAVRPEDIHALLPLAAEWKTCVADDVDSIRRDIEAGIKELGLGYAGEDYDELQDLIHQLSVFSRTIADNAHRLHDSLSESSDIIAAQQGVSGEGVPFPIPNFHIDPAWYQELSSGASIHARVPWHEGECERFTPEAALAWAIGDEGAASLFVNEMHMALEEQMMFYQANGVDLTTAEAQARKDAGMWLREFIDELRWEIYEHHVAVGDDLRQRVINTETGLTRPAFSMTVGRLPDIAYQGEAETFPGIVAPSYGQETAGQGGRLPNYELGGSGQMLPMIPSGASADLDDSGQWGSSMGLVPGASAAGMAPIFPPTAPVGEDGGVDWQLHGGEGDTQGGLYGGMLMSGGGMPSGGGSGGQGGAAGAGAQGPSGGAMVNRAAPQVRAMAPPPPPPPRLGQTRTEPEEEESSEDAYDSWLLEDDPWGTTENREDPFR